MAATPLPRHRLSFLRCRKGGFHLISSRLCTGEMGALNTMSLPSSASSSSPALCCRGSLGSSSCTLHSVGFSILSSSIFSHKKPKTPPTAHTQFPKSGISPVPHLAWKLHGNGVSSPCRDLCPASRLTAMVAILELVCSARLSKWK